MYIQIGLWFLNAFNSRNFRQKINQKLRLTSPTETAMKSQFKKMSTGY